MKEYDDKLRERAEPAAAAGILFRGIASLIGIMIIILGLVLALMIFREIHAAVKTPETIEPSLAKWAEVLDGEEIKITLKEEEISLPHMLGIVALGGGYLLLCWLAIGIMVAGGKIVSWSTGDREAVRKIIRETLGTRPRA